MKHTPAIILLAALLPGMGVPALGCGGSSEPAAQPRYPEKRRPPPLRSASDGEIMGADEAAPEDRLEASPTNEHPAKGWVIEDGKLVPEREAHHREEAHRRSGYAAEPGAGRASEPDCDPSATAADVRAADVRAADVRAADVRAAGATAPDATAPAATAAGAPPTGATPAAAGGRKRRPCPPPPQRP